jgi:hypothetical protein
MSILNEDDTIIETPVPGEDFIPETNIQPDLFQIEDEDTAPTTDDLTAQIAAQAVELEKLKLGSDLSAGMTQGFDTLARQLQSQNAPDYSNLPGLPSATPAPAAQYSLPDRESFEREFLTNPYDSLQKFLAPVVGNQQQVVNTQMAEMNKMISKNNTYMNETNKDILNKYGDEVGVYASRLTGNDPWGEAVKQVRSNHFADIMADQTKSIEEKMYEKAKADLLAEQTAAGITPASPVGITNLGQATIPTVKKVSITKTQMDKVKKLTALKFGPDSGAETELMMYNYLKERNEI